MGYDPIPLFILDKGGLNMNKKILEIAGISFALVFIILMAFIFGNVVDFGNKANSNITDLKEAVIAADIEQYNDSVVSGDTVISTINKLKETKNGIKMSYAVCDGSEGSSSAWKYYGYKVLKYDSSVGTSGGYIGTTAASDSYTSYKTSLKPGNTGYISPVQEYKSQIVLNENGVLVGIKFIRK